MLLDSIRIKNTKKKEERDIDVILSEGFSDYYMQKRLSGESRKVFFVSVSFSIFIHRFHHLKKCFSQNRMKNDLQNPEPYQEPL